MMLILLQALSNGFRIMSKDFSKNFRRRYYLIPAFTLAVVRISELYLSDQQFNFIIFLESITVLLTPMAICLFMYNNLQQLDWAEEYLILLNNVSI